VNVTLPTEKWLPLSARGGREPPRLMTYACQTYLATVSYSSIYLKRLKVHMCTPQQQQQQQQGP